MAPRRTYAHRHLRLQPTGLVYKVLALARRLGAPADTAEILIILRSRLLFKEIHSRTVGSSEARGGLQIHREPGRHWMVAFVWLVGR